MSEETPVTTKAIDETTNAWIIERLIQANSVEHRELPVTRDETKVERKLDLIKIQKRNDKGCQYYGVNFTPESFDADIAFIGKPLACDYLNTSFGTAFQKFNDRALLNAKEKNALKWNNWNDEEKLISFHEELSLIVNDWSMRAESKAKITTEVTEAGATIKLLISKGQKVGDKEFDAAMAVFNEVALRMAMM